MPTITLNRKEFENLVGKKISLEQLKDRISMLGTGLEKIDDNEIVVEIFPNRPDMLSEQGFARAFAGFIGVKKGLIKYKTKSSKDYSVIIDKSVNNVRPFTACAVVRNLKLDNEKIKNIIQIQEKLHTTFCKNRKKAAIGIYPLEKIKMPIRYKAMNPKDIKFQPLESAKKMDGLQILRDYPTGRDYAHLLEGKSKFPVFIDANNEILSMPPIINSHKTGKVTEDTKDVFIECSGFNFDYLNMLLNIIVCAMADMGGSIYEIELHYPNKKYKTPNLSPKKRKLDINYVNKVLGLSLKENEIKDLMARMGFEYKKGTVLIPPYRADIMHPIDFVEDIAIAYGYENFNPSMPNISTIATESHSAKLQRAIRQILVGLGLNEINTYHITSLELQTSLMETKMCPIELENPSTKEYSHLRQWLLPSLMQTLSINKSAEYPQNIFEINTVFLKDNSQETGILEKNCLAIALCGNDADYTAIRKIIDCLFANFGIKANIKDYRHNCMIEGRCASISINGKIIGFMGEIHPKVLDNFGIEMPVAACDIDIQYLINLLG